MGDQGSTPPHKCLTSHRPSHNEMCTDTDHGYCHGLCIDDRSECCASLKRFWIRRRPIVSPFGGAKICGKTDHEVKPHNSGTS